MSSSTLTGWRMERLREAKAELGAILAKDLKDTDSALEETMGCCLFAMMEMQMEIAQVLASLDIHGVSKTDL